MILFTVLLTENIFEVSCQKMILTSILANGLYDDDKEKRYQCGHCDGMCDF